MSETDEVGDIECDDCGILHISDEMIERACRAFHNLHYGGEEEEEAEPDIDPLPTEPEDDDLVTSDYLKFYRHGFQHKGPVVECREGERWAHAVAAYMDDDNFWPNVWYIGERGDVNLIDVTEAFRDEEK